MSLPVVFEFEQAGEDESVINGLLTTWASESESRTFAAETETNYATGYDAEGELTDIISFTGFDPVTAAEYTGPQPVVIPTKPK